jgi:biotin carboxyl carrier protein
MKWQILLGDRTVEITPEQLQAVATVETGVYSILIDGVNYEVRANPTAHGLKLEVDSRRFLAEVIDPRNASRGSRSALGAGRQKVVAPMPGRVIRVLVKVGDTVELGQGLVVVEAMKMQNEMKSSRPGRVVEVRVSDGDTVGSNDTLVVLE